MPTEGNKVLAKPRFPADQGEERVKTYTLRVRALHLERRWKYSAFKLFLTVLAALVLWHPAAVPQIKQVKRVVIFYELGLSSPAVAALDREIQAALQSTPFQIELYSEYMETTLFPDENAQRELRKSYIQKYGSRKPDLIITLGPSALKFIGDVHEKVFTHVPVVFGGTSEEQSDYPKINEQFTGIWEEFDPARTLEVALRLKPGTKHVVVLGGTSSYDRHLEALFRKRLREEA
jgi:hypothetical protein